MKAIVGAFNQENSLVGALSVITNHRVDLLFKLLSGHLAPQLNFQFLTSGLSAQESGVKTGGRGAWNKLQAVRLFFYHDRSSFLLPMLQNLLSMYNFHKGDLINITNRQINLYYHLQISSSLPGHLTTAAGGAGQRQTRSLLSQPRLNSSCHQILQ